MIREFAQAYVPLICNDRQSRSVGEGGLPPCCTRTLCRRRPPKVLSVQLTCVDRAHGMSHLDSPQIRRPVEFVERAVIEVAGHPEPVVLLHVR